MTRSVRTFSAGSDDAGTSSVISGATFSIILRASASPRQKTRPLVPRSRLPFEDLFQDIVLLQAVRLGMEVQQDTVAEDGDIEGAHILKGHMVAALHQRLGFRCKHQELRGADAGAI